LREFREADIKHVINTFSEGICYLDAQGKLLYHNYTASTHWNIDSHTSYELALQPTIARALMGTHLHREMVHLREHHTLVVNATPFFDERHTITGVLVVSQDVSEAALTEEQAETALNVLLESLLETFDIEDIDESMMRVASLIPSLESVDNSIALRVDPSTGRLFPLTIFGVSKHSFEEWQKELNAIKLSTEHLLQTPSMAILQAIHLARTITVDFSVDTTHSNPHDLRAAIYAPVFLRGKVVGLLGAERHRHLLHSDDYFPRWTVALLTALARIASMTIEKNMLLNDVERMQGEETLIKALVNQKDEFLLIAAHELKNPLTTILGMSQILQRRVNRMLHMQADSPSHTHELIAGLERIEHQARRSTHIINTLLEASRIELDRIDLVLEELDLLHLTRRILQEFAIIAPNYTLLLSLNGEPIPIDDDELDGKTPIVIWGDEQRLEQVLINLLSNAVKYSAEGSAVTVSIQQKDEAVEIAVADQGIGVPLAEQTRLTERFYRAQNVQNSRGLGLGLYLVHTLVLKHGGQLSVQSEGKQGKGSVFSIKLPVHPS
jgi:signal transduction histidine kinase